MKGIDYLRKKLIKKAPRVVTRYKFYEMKHALRDMKISTPKGLEGWKTSLGWCGKAVDSVADRLRLRGFGGDTFGLEELFRLNNQDILVPSAVLGALVTSCDFIHIAMGPDGAPAMQVIDGANATGVLDPVTQMLTEGYAVLERDEYGKPLREVYAVPGWQVFLQGGKVVEQVRNAAPWALLVPIIYRPDAVRPFGHSRISRACMDIQLSAMRTIKRSEISAEFYSFPQKYVLGRDPDGDPLDKWKATISSLLEISAGENGDKPTVGQFQQQSMQPHVDQLRMFASLFAGETGLTVDDLGFVSDNPASAEAIKASHDTLRLTAERAQACFGVGLLNAGYLARCLADGVSYQRQILSETRVLWEPAFPPDAAALSVIGDGAIKINQAVPGYFGAEALRSLTGIEGDI